MCHPAGGSVCHPVGGGGCLSLRLQVQGWLELDAKKVPGDPKVGQGQQPPPSFPRREGRPRGSRRARRT